jgi:hypothetical protein
MKTIVVILFCSLVVEISSENNKRVEESEKVSDECHHHLDLLLSNQGKKWTRKSE